MSFTNGSKSKHHDLDGGLSGVCLFLAGFIALVAFGSHQVHDRYGADLGALFAATPTAEPAKHVTTALISTPDMRADFTDTQTISRTGTLQRRSTLIETLANMGADEADAERALQPIYDAELIDPRRVAAGLALTASFTEDDGRLLSVSFKPESGRSILSKRMADGQFFASNLSVQRVPTVKRVSATISTSLYEAALDAGATDQQVADFAEIFAFDIDFQREIQAGDAFEIVYETFVDERGNHVSSGDILFAALDGRALDRSFYRHTPADDNITDYFTADGKSATRFLMKTPINGARLSSSFGRRRHPISGYSRLHKGTDFAARSGTPIFAAGNGVVERASRYGGYGKYENHSEYYSLYSEKNFTWNDKTQGNRNPLLGRFTAGPYAYQVF